MTNQTKTYLSLEEINLPANLKADVLKSVEKAIEIKNRNRKIIGFSIFSVSLISFIDFAISAVREFQQSGFSAYSSLIFSDSKLVLSNLGEFAFSLVDSLPFFAITITLISVLVILVSAQYIMNSKKELSYSFQ